MTTAVAAIEPSPQDDAAMPLSADLPAASAQSPKNPLARQSVYRYAADEVDAEVDRKAQTLGKTVKMKGFRPGRAPLRLLKQHYGKSCLVEILAHRAQQDFQKEHAKTKLASQPQFAPALIARDGDYSVHCHFEVLPPILPPDFSGKKLLRPVLTVGDEQVAQMIEHLRRNGGRYHLVQRAAVAGDSLVVDFKAFNGEALAEKAADRQWILGGAMLHGEISKQLVGAQSGDEREIFVTHPDDHQDEKLRGATVRLQVSVKSVSELRKPELNDDFFRLFGVTDGREDSFRKMVVDNLKRESGQRLDGIFHDRALNLLIDATPRFDFPQTMLQLEVSSLYQQTVEQYRRHGMTQWVSQLAPRQFLPQAVRRVALGLIFSEWQLRDAPVVSTQAIDKKLQALAASYESPDVWLATARANADYMESVRLSVLEEMAVDNVAEQATVEEEPISLPQLLGDEVYSPGEQ